MKQLEPQAVYFNLHFNWNGLCTESLLITEQNNENKENENLYVGNEMVVNEVQPLTSFQLSQIDSNNEAVSEVKGQTFILIKGVFFNSHFFHLH